MASTVENHVNAAEIGELPLVVHFPPAVALTEDQFFELACANEFVRLERNAQGDLIVMTPAGAGSSSRNSRINMRLQLWSIQDGTGVVFDSSAGFVLSNGAMRSPDSSWVRRVIWDAVPADMQEKFPHLCPDFVIEIRSPSDRLRVLQDKMAEYIECGVQLGWLIDPIQRRVFVRRPGAAVEELDHPETLSGDPLLRGFVLDLREIW